MVLQMRDGGDLKAMVEVTSDAVVVQTMFGPHVFKSESVAQVAGRLLELIRIKKGIIG